MLYFFLFTDYRYWVFKYTEQNKFVFGKTETNFVYFIDAAVNTWCIFCENIRIELMLNTIITATFLFSIQLEQIYEAFGEVIKNFSRMNNDLNWLSPSKNYRKKIELSFNIQYWKTSRFDKVTCINSNAIYFSFINNHCKYDSWHN